MRHLLLAVALFLGGINIGSAQILMLDFGPTTTPSAGKTLLPYTTGITGTSTFNTITTSSNVTSGLLFTDGTSATGLSLTYGGGLGTTATFPLSGSGLSISTGLTGTALGTGIYANSSASKDGFFWNATGGAAQQTTLALSIGGLSAGTYQVYMAGRNTNSSFGTGISEQFYSTITGTTPTSQNTTLLTGTIETNSTSASFIQGDNYVMLTETITAGQFLNIYANGFTGAGVNEDRGFLNYIELVPVAAVPEPGSFILLAMGFVLLALFRKYSLSRQE